MDFDKQIFDFVYEFALRDATLQNAYTGSLDLLRKNVAAKHTVRGYIDSIFNWEADEDSFWKTAQLVEESFSAFLPQQQPRFTFGNTQKLINMSAKYMFITCYQNEGLRSAFESCHCPMDSIMVNTVIDELERAYDNSFSSDERKEIRGFMFRGWKGYLRSSWSRMESSDVNQYKFYQRAVQFLSGREGISPLEYDFLMWGR